MKQIIFCWKQYFELMPCKILTIIIIYANILVVLRQ